MKVRYSYKKYPYSDEATDWSRRASRAITFSPPFVLACTAFFSLLFQELHLFDKTLSYIVGASIPIIVLVIYISYCRKKEKFSALCGILAERIQRPLTDEEKERFHEILKHKRKPEDFYDKIA